MKIVLLDIPVILHKFWVLLCFDGVCLLEVDLPIQYIVFIWLIGNHKLCSSTIELNFVNDGR